VPQVSLLRPGFLGIDLYATTNSALEGRRHRRHVRHIQRRLHRHRLTGFTVSPASSQAHKKCNQQNLHKIVRRTEYSRARRARCSPSRYCFMARHSRLLIFGFADSKGSGDCRQTASKTLQPSRHLHFFLVPHRQQVLKSASSLPQSFSHRSIPLIPFDSLGRSQTQSAHRFVTLTISETRRRGPSRARCTPSP
jgi:hypothetical protein